MEQLTWPRGSGGHIFSTISTSDYGNGDPDRRRRNGFTTSADHTYQPCMEALDADLQSTGRFHGQRYLEQAFGNGVDNMAHKNQSFMKMYVKSFLDEQSSAPVKVPKSSELFSRKERKQEASVSSCLSEVNRTISSKLSAPQAPSSSPYATRNHGSCASLANPHDKKHTVGLCPSQSNNANHKFKVYMYRNPSHEMMAPSSSSANFAMLPDDILLRVAGSFSWPNLWSASKVCRSWCQALAPLREAMHFVHWGKRFKHGQGGVAQNSEKALHSFLNGAKRGCAAAMVDAGLLLWNMGRKEDGVYWYKKAAELGDPAGQCNLGLAYLEDSNNPVEAVKLFQRAATAGYVRAQYSLALCLQKGRGVDCSIVKAARWYQRAAEGGSARAMYNLALCYRKGEGLIGDLHEARRWMKRAALAGHRKAQFEHGLTLFAENEGGLALVFLELATRAGETAATHLRDALIQQLSPKTRAHAITCADKWQAKVNAHA